MSVIVTVVDNMYIRTEAWIPEMIWNGMDEYAMSPRHVWKGTDVSL